METSPSIRRRTYEVLEVGRPGDTLSLLIDGLIMTIVAGNVLAVILESVDAIATPYADLFTGFERASLAAYTAEFVLRIWAAAEAPDVEGGSTRRRLRYLCSPLAIFDFLVIAPFFLSAFIAIDLRFVRILRLLRIVKLTRYSTALLHIAEVYRLQRSGLMTAFLLMGIAVVLSASLLHMVESSAQPEHFGSIPQAMWWAIITLTTVGYGDVTPVTSLGKLVASGISIVGIAMVALPTSLFASGFAHVMTRNEQLLEDEALDVVADGEITDDEVVAFEELAERLYIEPEIAQEIIEAAHRKQEVADLGGCPHCGKSIYG